MLSFKALGTLHRFEDLAKHIARSEMSCSIEYWACRTLAVARCGSTGERQGEIVNAYERMLDAINRLRTQQSCLGVDVQDLIIAATQAAFDSCLKNCDLPGALALRERGRSTFRELTGKQRKREAIYREFDVG